MPLSYFAALGVDVSINVGLVLATHWHDDHIHGLADTYARASNATVAFPLAMMSDEYLRFATIFNNLTPAGRVSSGVRELGEILVELAARHWRRVALTKSWQVIFRVDAGVLSHGRSVIVEALSPSDYDVMQFVALLGQQQTSTGVARRAPLYDRNDVSTAVRISFGDDIVVLGADLENVADGRSGWRAVFGAQQFPQQQASLLKVPHHGSITGDHPDIWSRLCAPQPITTLTPWARGRGRLPSRSDINRIVGHATQSYSAARTVTSGDRHQLQAVNSVLKRTNSRIRNVDRRLGHVRHRKDALQANSHWNTDLLGTACDLRQVAA